MVFVEIEGTDWTPAVETTLGGLPIVDGLDPTVLELTPSELAAIEGLVPSYRILPAAQVHARRATTAPARPKPQSHQNHGRRRA